MRGQAHTLEAAIASLLMLSAIIFAIQMTAVTPLSASTSSQHIENQQRATASGVLATAADNDTLKPAVLYWNEGNARFHNGEDSEPYYTSGSTEPTNRFGQLLQSAFGDSGIAYNVNLRFGESTDRVQYIYSGTPSDNAVTATYTVSLFIDDPIYDANSEPTGTTVADSNYASELGITPASGNTFSTVRVEVVVWQI